jgi:hypothetical protein
MYVAQAAIEQPAGTRRSLALALALQIWRSNGEDAGLLDTLRVTVAETGLSKKLDALLAPRIPSEMSRLSTCSSKSKEG